MREMRVGPVYDPWRIVVCAVLVAIGACAPRDADLAVESGDDAAEAAAPAQDLSIGDIGLQTPESVLHDAGADVYLVSNIAGYPSGRTNDGFISRIAPDGSVQELRWIQGGQGDAVLHAPKGMAIRGDSLFVADIDTVRIFHRQTGAPLGAWGVPDASFLNDLTAGPDGAIYVSDTGIIIDAEGMRETGTDAVYRFSPTGEARAIVSGADLGRPNGLVADDAGVFMVGFGSNQVVHITDGGEIHPVATVPAGQLDGVVRLGDGSLLVSSWEGGAVYRIGADREVSTVVEGVEAPADIGFDNTRDRVLIPLFTTDALEIRTLQ